MNEDFCPFELAVKLKEKGFREKCIKHCYPNSTDWFISSTPECDNYSSYIDIPTIPQVLKWLRKEKKIHVEVMFIRPLHNRTKYYITDIDGSRGNFMDVADASYETWEQAALAGIEYVLDNLI